MRKTTARLAAGSASAILLASAGLLGGGGALAATRSAVPQGAGAAVTANSTVFGNTPADTPVTVSIVLNTRHANQLSQYVKATVTPGNRSYRRYLSTQQFAQQYGQSPQVVQGIVNYFKGYGITAQVYPDNLDITLNGTAGAFDKAFGVQLKNMEYHGKHFHGPKKAPTLPNRFKGPILSVLGLTNYSSLSTSSARVPAKMLAKLPSQDKSGTTTTPPSGWESPQKLENQYNITPLVKKGDLGQGQTIGIVTLASVDPSDAYTYWKAYGVPVTNSHRVSLVNIDGGAGPVSNTTGSGETTIDVEQSGAIAPDANIIVYQAPNTDSGFVDAFFNAISSNKAGSLSVSWGESETAVNYFIQKQEEDPNYAQAFNEAYEEAAAQGISTFAATGDYGAYQAVSDLGTTNLAAGNPADSPYITAAGGTTLPSAGTTLQSLGISIPQQRAWAWDYFFPLWKEFGASNEQSWAEQNTIGSNGGYSVIFREPSYQRGVSGLHNFQAVPWFTPIDNNTNWSFNADPTVVGGPSNGGRAIPDLSMNADPYTGYAVYSNALYGGWSVGWGGTSFVAPQLNGITALINESVGSRVGFWNPQIYRFAQQPNSPLSPLDTAGTSNDNLYYTGTPGTVYNAATGLGTPNVAALSRAFTSQGQGPGPR